MSVATVSVSGLVTALAAGSAVISASSEGQTGSATITVSAPAPPPPPSTLPGTVSNLSVSAIASTSVTLSFTQVNDGTGQPAKYDVRYAVAPISWGSAASTTSGTCTTPVAGTAIGSLVTCTVLGLLPSTNYNFQLNAFRGTLNVDAVFGSLSNIASASTTAQASPPPPPPVGGSNEPTGMTRVVERAFNTLQESPWDTDSQITIVQDATAPKSPSSALRFTFPTGFTGGGESNGHTGVALSGNYRVLYISYWAKYSANWYGHETGINKQAYAWVTAGYTPFVMEAEGSGTASLKPRPILQRMIRGDGNYSPNLVPSAVFPRGAWFRVEIVLTGNTSGTANGAMDVWLNGVHVGSWGGLQWTSGTTAWNVFELYPVWGGVGSRSVPSTMTWDVDHTYLSGKN